MLCQRNGANQQRSQADRHRDERDDRFHLRAAKGVLLKEVYLMCRFFPLRSQSYTLGRVIALKTLKLLHDFLKKKITEETTLDELIDYLVRIGKHVVKALPLSTFICLISLSFATSPCDHLLCFLPFVDFPTENIIRRFIFILNSKKVCSTINAVLSFSLSRFLSIVEFAVVSQNVITIFLNFFLFLFLFLFFSI